jgi:aminoglycoside 2''-phosphotransferase
VADNTGFSRPVPLQPDWSAIASEVRHLPIRSATRIGEGWTAVAYRVDALVFKFPKRATAWEELDREIAFLAYARQRLPLPVPEHVHRARESAGAPHGYVVYRNIPGVAVEARTLQPNARTVLAQVLANFLRALHDMDPAPIASILPHEDEYAVALQHQRDAEETIAPHLSSGERRCLRDVLAQHLGDPLNFAGRARILHADLSVDHVLCVDQTVTGILDWGDVCLGDPDYDFGYLYDDFGEAFVREMGTHYGHADPERLVRKARYFSITDQIATIAHSEEALPGDVDGSWERLHALLDDVSTAHRDANSQ